MYYKCCVENCASIRKDVKLHRFPSSETGLKKWLQCIHSSRLRNLSVRELQKMHVCHKHFERRFITEKSHVRLGSYPTLFSEEEIESGVPSVTQDSEPPEHIMRDHCYDTHKLHDDHSYCKPKPSSDETLGVAEPMTMMGESASKVTAITSQEPLPGSSHEQPATRQPLREIQNLPQYITGSSHEQPATRQPLREIQNLPQYITEPVTGTRVSASKSKVTASHVHLSGPATLVVSPPKSKLKRRRRIIRRVTALSPSARKIYIEYRKSVKQLDFMKRAKRAIKFCKTTSFKMLTSNMNPIAKKIIWMQITQSQKKLKGRRFTEEEKMISLSILKQSPKGYKFLRKIFILPSRNTLNKMISSLNVQPGINKQIFDAIKEEVKSWSENKKWCSLIFDEVSLEPGLEYDKVHDNLNGFVHLKIKKNEYADHALSFMIRGAVHKWQQPIVYYFCAGATKNEELRVILKEIIRELINAGLLPVALICDQGQSFQSALNGLLEETRKDQMKAGKQTDDVITISGQDMSVIFDPPHLIKGIRNNFITKNLVYDGKLCKWSDIVDVYETDCGHAQARLLHKLNDTHVIPEKICKMKVKNCTRVLSKTVAAALSYTSQFSHYSDGRPVSETLKNTAEAIAFFDDLFDSTNGATTSAKQSRGKVLRKAVTEKSPHLQFWRDAIKTLEKIKFADEKRGEISVPTLKNWATTLRSLIRLWQFFQSKNITIMRPRYFNSDPIENFFGQVRAYNFRNTDPNCHTFISTFKSLLITRFINFHSTGFNCEEDGGVQLLQLKNLFQPTETKYPDTSTSLHNQSSGFDAEDIQSQARRERLNVHSRAYTAGWLVRKILQKIHCRNCTADLTTAEGSIHNWISQREYNSFVKQRLTYPSEYAVRYFGIVVKESNEYLEREPHTCLISQEIKRRISSKYSFDFLTCDFHKSIVTEYFLCITIKFTLFNWCSTINKILKGTDVSRLKSPLPLMQQKALDKMKKRFRNKNK